MSEHLTEDAVNWGETDYDKAISAVLHHSNKYNHPFSRVAMTNEVFQAIPENSRDIVVLSLINMLEQVSLNPDSSIDEINSLLDVVEQDYELLNSKYQSMWSVRMEGARHLVASRQEQAN